MLKDTYEVKPLNKEVNTPWTIEVPGSKSITNRALLLAALSDRKIKISGALFSDDSRVFMEALKTLGFDVLVNEEEKYAVICGLDKKIPNNNISVYVGSAGTAARFITAMLAFSGGKYTINASAQMEKRPMKGLFDALIMMGAKIKCLKADGCLPVEIMGITESKVKTVDLDISESTQFLSALMMTKKMLKNAGDININVISKRKTGSYVEITKKVMEDMDKCGSEYRVEPDLSAAAYFYAAAFIAKRKVVVKDVHFDTMQGDINFVKLLVNMGATAVDTKDGIELLGPDEDFYGTDVYMKEFSDQALTLAAVAAFAKSETKITGISHIRGQECDRIEAIRSNLTALGCKVEEIEDGVVIRPGKLHGANIETYEDHRVAMSFALVGLLVPGVVILNPMCCKKTFENYFDVFEKLQ